MECHYPGDLSDAERALLEPFFINSAAPRKRGRCESSESARRSFNAVRYLLKTGCQWRMRPRNIRRVPRCIALDQTLLVEAHPQAAFGRLY